MCGDLMEITCRNFALREGKKKKRKKEKKKKEEKGNITERKVETRWSYGKREEAIPEIRQAKTRVWGVVDPSLQLKVAFVNARHSPVRCTGV